MIAYLASLLGASEAALSLLCTLFAAYPLGLLHRRFLSGKSPDIQHAFFFLTGFALVFLNYGMDCVHSLICIAFTYVMTTYFGRSLTSVGVCFASLMSYLLLGYHLKSTSDYDITWTMPHCVLTLRLIAVAFDVYDGSKPNDQLSADQKKSALKNSPTFLQLAGHCYFFGGFMVGPQFSLTRYLSFVHQTGLRSSVKTGCSSAAISNLLQGLLVLALHQVGNALLPERYVMSDSFNGLNLLYKVILIGIWSKIMLYKYVACWLISEGSCMLTGMTYNGEDAQGKPLWDGCNNIHLWNYETTTTFGGLVKSFNINTNHWVGQYVFKRLRFLGNKLVSQLFALLFLAVWHGLHSGYYVCFFNEFLVVKLERDVQAMVQKSPFLTKLFGGVLRIPVLIFLKLYLVCILGYCLIPFVLLKVNRWWDVYASMFFVGHIICLGLPIAFLACKALSGKKRSPKSTSLNDQQINTESANNNQDASPKKQD